MKKTHPLKKSKLKTKVVKKILKPKKQAKPDILAKLLEELILSRNTHKFEFELINKKLEELVKENSLLKDRISRLEFSEPKTIEKQPILPIIQPWPQPQDPYQPWPAPAGGAIYACSTCGINFSGLMGYGCSRTDCPSIGVAFGEGYATSTGNLGTTAGDGPVGSNDSWKTTTSLTTCECGANPKCECQ